MNRTYCSLWCPQLVEEETWYGPFFSGASPSIFSLLPRAPGTLASFSPCVWSSLYDRPYALSLSPLLQVPPAVFWLLSDRSFEISSLAASSGKISLTYSDLPILCCYCIIYVSSGTLAIDIIYLELCDSCIYYENLFFFK